jgi:hypothetical protein
LNPSPALDGLHATAAAINNNGQVVGCAQTGRGLVTVHLPNGGGRALMAFTGSP